MTEAEKNFHEALHSIAEMCGVKLNKFMIEVFDKELSPYGYAQATNALYRFSSGTKSWKFPTPQMVKDILEPVDEMSQAQMTVGRIIKSVNRFGYGRASEAKIFIGDIGWQVVEYFGGWTYLCENLGHRMDVGTARAQMRDIALSIIKKEIEVSNQIEHKPNQQLEAAAKLITKRME